MWKRLEESARLLVEARRSSSSDEEFRLKEAAAGGGRLAGLLFRAGELRRRNPSRFENAELGLLCLLIAAFSGWAGVAGPGSVLAGIVAILAGCAAGAAVTLAICAFDGFCDRVWRE